MSLLFATLINHSERVIYGKTDMVGYFWIIALHQNVKIIIVSLEERVQA